MPIRAIASAKAVQPEQLRTGFVLICIYYTDDIVSNENVERDSSSQDLLQKLQIARGVGGGFRVLEQIGRVERADDGRARVVEDLATQSGNRVGGLQ